MSDAATGDLRSADHILQTRGTSRDLGAFVVTAAFDRGGSTAAFGLGDGTVRLTRPDEWQTVEAHDGGLLSLAPDCGPAGWISGGDDGRFQRIAADGSLDTIAPFGRKWVENVTSFTDGKARLTACSVGKRVLIYNAGNEELKVLEHPSSVTGMAFDGKGKRIAASHYNGASIWFVASKSATPRVLEWKGSHTGICISPDGDSIVTSMQENSLHGWRLSDSQHMRMTGYPTKTNALGFTRNNKWLASSGAEGIVLWPFFGGGPMGKPPKEMAGVDGVMCTTIAVHPQHDAVAAGFSDGLVLMADITSSRILPIAGTGRGPVSAMAWSPDGVNLAFGTENGFAAIIDFSKR